MFVQTFSGVALYNVREPHQVAFSEVNKMIYWHPLIEKPREKVVKNVFHIYCGGAIDLAEIEKAIEKIKKEGDEERIIYFDDF
jgi:hypothetical protein